MCRCEFGLRRVLDWRAEAETRTDELSAAAAVSEARQCEQTGDLQRQDAFKGMAHSRPQECRPLLFCKPLSSVLLLRVPFGCPAELGRLSVGARAMETAVEALSNSTESLHQQLERVGRQVALLQALPQPPPPPPAHREHPTPLRAPSLEPPAPPPSEEQSYNNAAAGPFWTLWWCTRLHHRHVYHVYGALASIIAMCIMCMVHSPPSSPCVSPYAHAKGSVLSYQLGSGLPSCAAASEPADGPLCRSIADAIRQDDPGAVLACLRAVAARVVAGSLVGALADAAAGLAHHAAGMAADAAAAMSGQSAAAAWCLAAAIA